MYKDVAKWLMTFTPISAFLTLTLTFAPRADAIIGMGFSQWVCAFPLVAASVVVTLIATVVIIVMCSRVLLVEAGKWTDLQKKENWFSAAFSDHAVGLPLFPASDNYTEAETKARSDQASPAEQTALAATSRRILELSESQNARDRFKEFSIAYVICTVLILAGLAIATVGLPANPDPVTKPTPVSILMQPGTEERFSAASGCVTMQGTTAIAVGGLWNRPKLQLIGPGCPSGEWTAPVDLGATIAPK
jgi:hypothetical protein